MEASSFFFFLNSGSIEELLEKELLCEYLFGGVMAMHHRMHIQCGITISMNYRFCFSSTETHTHAHTSI